MIKQIIKYDSNNTYFAGFLQEIINKSGIVASVVQNKNQIELNIDQDDKNLEEFNKNISKYLPHSIFLKEIETLNSKEPIKASTFISKQYNLAPCKKCLELLSDPSSEHYLDDSLVCTHYSNSIDQKYEDFTTFSPHYSPNSSVLITDTSKIDELFIVTEDEIKALFSIEKPTIKATIKSETLKTLTGKNYINIKAPYNNRSTLISINAKESGIDYLFFEDSEDLRVVVIQKNITIIKATRLTTPLELLNENKIVNRFLNIANEAQFKNGIGANLSKNNISFLVSNELGAKEVIKFQQFKLSDFFYGVHNDGIKIKLIDNFYKKYPHIQEKLENITDIELFEFICLLLDIKEGSFESLSDKAFEFRGNGGLKIDMYYSSEGFDYLCFLSSIISFKLAGAQTHYIAYSIFEAFGDMTINTLNQLKTKFKIDNIIMMGDMFENSILYSRILSKYQLSKPYFPKTIALDE